MILPLLRLRVLLLLFLLIIVIVVIIIHTTVLVVIVVLTANSAGAAMIRESQGPSLWLDPEPAKPGKERNWASKKNRAPESEILTR